MQIATLYDCFFLQENHDDQSKFKLFVIRKVLVHSRETKAKRKLFTGFLF